MVPGWPSKHTVQFESGEVDKVVLWNGKNGGAWFRLLGPEEQKANSASESGKPVDQSSNPRGFQSSNNNTRSGQLTVQIQELCGVQLTEEPSFFASEPVL